MMISNIREDGVPIGSLPDGEMMFHHDMIHREIPDKATLLYAVEIPSVGGDTWFASGYAAYESLSEEEAASTDCTRDTNITMARRKKVMKKGLRPLGRRLIRWLEQTMRLAESAST